MNASVNDNTAALLGWLDGQRDAMVALLRDIVNIDSGTYNKAGVDRVGAVLRAHLEAGGAACEVIPHERFGDGVRAAAGGDGARLGDGHVLLLGHRDTVFPDGTVARRPFRTDGERAYGPGVVDMKAGLVVNTFLLEGFARFSGAPRPLIGLYTGDEEIASPSGRPVIEAHARGARAVFNAEPARPNGSLVTGRKGATFLKVEVTGKAAHSGGAHAKGISAIEELCRKVVALHALTDYESGSTVNVGLIDGGSSVNTVAPYAHAEVDVRYVTLATMEGILARAREVLAATHLPGTTTRVTGQASFLPLVETPAGRELFELYAGCAAEVGFEVAGEFTGGSADSGFTSAVGAPTLCGTGPVGGLAHSDDEYCELATLVPRAKALALAISRLAA